MFTFFLLNKFDTEEMNGKVVTFWWKKEERESEGNKREKSWKNSVHDSEVHEQEMEKAEDENRFLKEFQSWKFYFDILPRLFNSLGFTQFPP